MDKKNQISINIAPDIAGGKYANLAIIGHSSSEFTLDFASVLPGPNNVANVQARVIMAPEHAKRLLLALQDNVQKYEMQFGQIQFNTPAAPSVPMAAGGCHSEPHHVSAVCPISPRKGTSGGTS